MVKRLGTISGLLLMALVFSVMFLGFSSAISAKEISEQTIRAFVDFLEPVLAVVFGGTSWSGLLLFEKLLIFIVFVSVVYLAVGEVPVFKENPKVRWVISIVVPLIGVRFLDYDWLMAILLQYKLLAIAITALLPFILFFFFIYNTAGEHDIIRKIGWIFFIVVYLGLWATSQTQQADIYFWTMVAAFFFLLFDGTIHRYYRKQEMKEAGAQSIYQYIAKIDSDINEINRSSLPQRVKDKLIKKKENDKKSWYKRL